MEVMTVLDEIMVNGQMWPHKDGVELYATEVTMWNEFCCFNATPWDETSFNEMSYIERGLWMNARKQIQWIHENEMTQQDGASPIVYYKL